MPYDPTKPADNSDLISAEIRSQLLALHQDTQTRATFADLAANIANTSASSNNVATLSTGFGDGNLQIIADKIDELITALRR